MERLENISHKLYKEPRSDDNEKPQGSSASPQLQVFSFIQKSLHR